MKATALAAFIFPLSVFSAVINPTDADLRAAVQTESVITFNASGTINLIATIEINRDVTIDGGAHTIVIDGQNGRTLFKVNAGKRVTFQRLTLANGRNQGPDGDMFSDTGKPGFGGALQNAGGEVTLENCILNNNSAIGGNAYTPFFGQIANAGGTAFGGAIHQTTGSLRVTACEFNNNFANGGHGGGNGFARGGAIYAEGGAVNLEDSIFLNNSTAGGGSQGRDLPGGDATGGAVYVSSANLDILGGRFEGNQAIAGSNNKAFGGAIAALNNNVTVARATFRQNHARGGDGIYWRGQFSRAGEPGRGGALFGGAGSTVTIINSAFDANHTRGGRNYSGFDPFPTVSGAASQGGAVYVTAASSIVNSTFHANAAYNYLDPNQASGGAIEAEGELTLSHITAAANSCVGPIINAATAATLRANVLGQNAGERNFQGPFTDSGYNLSADSTPALTHSGSANNIDPKLGPFGNYGGPTETLPLLLGSPAIDRVADNVAPSTDQRLRARPFGPHPDSGAFESSPPYHIIGKLNGVVPTGTTINAGASVTPDPEGRFLLSGIPAGPFNFTITAPNAIFRPNPANLNIQTDQLFEARGFTVQAFGWDPDQTGPTYTFAARAGETWDFFSSTNLIDWSPAGSQTFTTDGVHSIPLTQFNLPVFLKAVRR